MIAQPVLITPATPKPAAAHAHAQPPVGKGFLALLATRNSALADLIRNTSGSAATAANNNNDKKPAKSGTANATPDVATAPISPATVPIPPATAPSKQASGNGNDGATPSGRVPASTAADGGSQDATTGAQPGSTGNSTDFGAEVKARIVAGAPIYASQPSTAMASVPAHVLDAPVAHPQPAAPPAKTSDDSASPKGDAAIKPASVNAGNADAASPSQPQQIHAVAAAPGTNPAIAGNSAPATANSNGSGNGADATNPTAASASVLAQPNAPTTAPVQAEAAVHTAAPYIPVGEQVALNIKQAIIADNNEIRIQLKPASLGTIDVKLHLTHDGRVNAVISADRSDTLNMLRQGSATLQQSLRNAGLNADANSLNFSLRSDTQSFAQNSFQGGSGHSGGGSSYTNAASGTLARVEAAAVRRFHSGALDIHV